VGIGGVVMNLFLNIIYKVLLAPSFAASLYIGFYVGGLAQDSFGFPWNYVALLLTFLACYAFFVCIVLNQVIFRKTIEQNTPIFNHDDPIAIPQGAKNHNDIFNVLE
jgi:Na+/serine symporter